MAAGAGDTAAALHAAGLRPDEAMLTLGSGGQWVVPVPSAPGRKPRSAPPDLYRAVGDGYCRLAAVQNVGVTLDWVRGLFGATWEELYDTASRPRRPDAPRLRPRLPGRSAADRDPAWRHWTGLTARPQNAKT